MKTSKLKVRSDALSDTGPKVCDRAICHWGWLALLTVVADQLSKYCAEYYLELYQPVAVISFLNFTLAYNTGAAFSFLHQAGGWQNTFFIVIALIMSLVLLVMLMGLICLPILYVGLLKDYQRDRVNAFIFQASPSEQARQDEAYHMIRSKIAVGSGGVTGKGLMEGAQQVPYNETDFIFTVVAEEWGFMGSMLVIGLYLLLLLFVADVAVTTTEPSGKLLAGGVFTLLFVQVAVNIGMTVGLAPITGLTLPFLSYGGSSLLSLTLAIGLVLNVRLYPDFIFKRDL